MPGFWCAKFEMSKETKDGSDWVKSNNPTGSVETSSTLRAVSKPGISSWREIGITKCYANSYNYDRVKESHLMKNSEWGAVAYLTHSQFGRDEQEVNINNNNDYLTGYSGEGPDVTKSSDTVKTYDYKNTIYGVKASSTGNIYGIYDLSGGAYEYIAGFYSESTSAYITSIKSVSEWEKYATEYTNNTNSPKGIEIYNVGKTGDATKEVNIGYVENNYRSWNKDYSHYVYSESPFFIRGGCITDGISGGIFCSYRTNGINIPNVSFRVVMCLQN